MSRTKIIDIYKEVIGQQTGNRAMFGDSFPGTMEFMDVYLVEYTNFDRYFAHKYTTLNMKISYHLHHLYQVFRMISSHSLLSISIS